LQRNDVKELNHGEQLFGLAIPTVLLVLEADHLGELDEALVFLVKHE
jgi:hypothetical protein